MSKGSNSGRKKAKGIYQRPSAAIERGSGFFVPGLEGSRVRILFGLVVLFFNFINRVLFNVDVTAMTALSFSSNVVNFFGILLLIQGSVEFAKENGLGDKKAGEELEYNDDKGLNRSSDMRQVISSSLDGRDEAVDAVRWAGKVFLLILQKY